MFDEAYRILKSVSDSMSEKCFYDIDFILSRLRVMTMRREAMTTTL
jgi:hypothetical protein